MGWYAGSGKSIHVLLPLLYYKVVRNSHKRDVWDLKSIKTFTIGGLRQTEQGYIFAYSILDEPV